MKKTLTLLFLLLTLCLVLISCGDGNTDDGDSDIPGHTHSYSDWTTVSNPTCTQKGSKTRTCTSCMSTETVDIDMLPHELQSPIVTQSTCKVQGSSVKKCKNCEYSDIELLELSTAHSYTENYVTTLFEHYYECTVCGLKKDVQSHIYCDGNTTGTENGCCRICNKSGATLGINYYLNTEQTGYVASTPYPSTEFFALDTVIFPSYYNNLPVVDISLSFPENTPLKTTMLPLYLENLSLYSFRYCWQEVCETENGIAYLGNWAFAHIADTAMDITLRDGTVGIASYAFGMKNIEGGKLELPASVKYICESAISAPWITELKISSTSVKIDDYAFTGLKSLEKLEIADGHPEYFSVNNCLVNKSRKAIILAGVNAQIPNDPSIDTVACNMYITNKNYSIPSNIKKLESMAFAGCSFENITISEGLEVIGANAFYNNPKLKSVSLPSTVKTLSSNVFSACPELTTVSLNEGLISMDSGTFYACPSLNSITLPSTLTSITGTIPQFSGCIALTELTISPNNPVYTVVGNCIIEKATKTIINGYCNSVIPTSSAVATKIAPNAFYGTETFTELTIGSNITEIGKSAFYGCKNLVSITIPFTGKTADHSNLEYSEKQFGYIFGSSFNIPTSLRTIVVTGGSELSNSAFYGCRNVQSISITSYSLNYIGKEAFADCSALTSLYISTASYSWVPGKQDIINGYTFNGSPIALTIDNLRNTYKNVPIKRK